MNQRLSTLATWLLKRASRSAAHAAYRNAASQPILPSVPPSSFSDTSAQWYITSAGAMPKLIRSASESYCTPNSLWVLVSRSEEHTSELQSLMRISYAVFCLKKKTKYTPDKMNTTY